MLCRELQRISEESARPVGQSQPAVREAEECAARLDSPESKGLGEIGPSGRPLPDLGLWLRSRACPRRASRCRQHAGTAHPAVRATAVPALAAPPGPPTPPTPPTRQCVQHPSLPPPRQLPPSAQKDRPAVSQFKTSDA